MSSMFRFGSKRDLRGDQHKCSIKLLHDNEVLDNVDFEVRKRRHDRSPFYILVVLFLQKDAKGQFLLDHVFKYLGLTETDFFGLRFTDSKNEKVMSH